VAAAMSIEALLGTDRPFAADLQAHAAPPGPGRQRRQPLGHPGRLADRGVPPHRGPPGAGRLLAALRPQVVGAARDTLAFAEEVAGRELASAIDNPVVLDDGRVESVGNFHGAPSAFACDFLANRGGEVGAIAERRVDRPARRQAVPRACQPFLAADPGVDSGLDDRPVHGAALVAENRRLAAPASVDSLPTSAMQEDHVSMGWAAARKLRRALVNLTRIAAIELVVAARALDLLGPADAGHRHRSGARCPARRVPGAGPDRFLAPELAAAEAVVAAGTVVAAVEAVTGPLR